MTVTQLLNHGNQILKQKILLLIIQILSVPLTYLISIDVTCLTRARISEILIRRRYSAEYRLLNNFNALRIM